MLAIYIGSRKWAEGVLLQTPGREIADSLSKQIMEGKSRQMQSHPLHQAFSILHRGHLYCQASAMRRIPNTEPRGRFVGRTALKEVQAEERKEIYRVQMTIYLINKILPTSFKENTWSEAAGRSQILQIFNIAAHD